MTSLRASNRPPRPPAARPEPEQGRHVSRCGTRCTGPRFRQPRAGGRGGPKTATETLPRSRRLGAQGCRRARRSSAGSRLRRGLRGRQWPIPTRGPLQKRQPRRLTRLCPCWKSPEGRSGHAGRFGGRAPPPGRRGREPQERRGRQAEQRGRAGQGRAEQWGRAEQRGRAGQQGRELAECWSRQRRAVPLLPVPLRQLGDSPWRASSARGSPAPRAKSGNRAALSWRGTTWMSAQQVHQYVTTQSLSHGQHEHQYGSV